MTSGVQSAAGTRADVRTIVGSGVKLGVITAVGVALFALLSRAMSGTVETVVQSLLVLAGGALFSYLPAAWVRPRDADSIAWASLVGLLGALVFTVLDTALLRPVHLYHWTWDQIGGGSGFWYIPVWWMGSATLAWLGAWTVSLAAGTGGGRLPGLIARTVVVAILIFIVLVAADIGPFHTAMMALAFSLALVVHVPLTAMLSRR